MSIRVMSWVWDNAQAEGIDRLVLLAIADAAADDGGNAWPSVETIAAKTKVHERTVQRAIKRLAEAGEILIRKNAGRNGVNVYRVAMGLTESHPSTESPRQSVTPAESRERGGTQSPKPSLPKEPKKTTSSLTRGIRITTDWTPPADAVAWARQHQIPDDLARRETEKFIDYWIGQPGQRGVKTGDNGWPAAWRNWMRRASEDRPPNRGQPGTALATRVPAQASQRVMEALTVAERLRATE